MVSVGNRCHITDITYHRLSMWAASHGYSSMLIKKDLSEGKLAPHFNKLIAHQSAPGYQRYIIVDDDILFGTNCPPMEDVPAGYVGLCKDPVQTLTTAAHIKWTGNTGFIVAGTDALRLLEEAYSNGEYPYNFWDGTGKGIWGPHDQAALNNVVFSHNRVFKLNQRWNYQAIVAHYSRQNIGWHKWKDSKWHRLWYYFLLLLPFSKPRRLINQCYGLHLTMGLYPKFFSLIHP